MSYSREWSMRLLHEASYHKQNSFLTVTYNDESLPPDGSLDKAVLQRLIKRFRKAISPIKVKYFGCGEYGDDYARPHYHLIILGWRPSDKYFVGFKDGKRQYASKLLNDVWPYGFNNVGTVTYDSCRYVCDYVFKKYDHEKATEVYGDRIPPFRLVSNGLGKRYAQDNEEKLRAKLGDTIRGKPVGIPRYYRKVLNITTDEMLPKVVKRLKEVAEHYDVPIHQAELAANIPLKQREKNLITRQNMKKKRKF